MSRSPGLRKLTADARNAGFDLLPTVRPQRDAVLYSRVSSKDQEKEGFSIPAQEKLLRSYALGANFRVVGEYVDVETAKKAGRTSFDEMMGWLQRTPSCKVILVEKTDRLYRNLRDWVDLDGMDLEIHLVKENAVLSDGSRSHEKFIHGIKVLMAKNYIDNLSEEVKKGMLEKATQGIWPSAAPLGYRNVEGPAGKRIVEPDPVAGPVVRRLFELYAAGGYALKDLAAEAKRVGLTSRSGRANVPIQTFHQILQNPLYKGEFIWNGQWYAGTHTALVTPELWDRVQEVMEGRGKAAPRRGKNDFPFTGLVQCGVCAEDGDAHHLVGELKKKKYVYYHCATCQKLGRPSAYVRQEVLSAAFTAALRRLRLDDEVVGWVREALHMSHEEQQRYHRDAVSRLQRQQAAIQKRVDVLYEDRLDGRIHVATYEQKANEMRAQQAHVLADIATHQRADKVYMEEGIALLELAGSALELYESQSASQQRRMLGFLCSNSEFRDGALTVTFRKPFDTLAESIEAAVGAGDASCEFEGAYQEWRPRLDSNQRPTG